MLSARLPATLEARLGHLARHPLLRRVAAPLAAALLVTRMLYAPIQALHGGGSDYVSFATGARVLATGSRCLYCVPTQADAQAQVLGYRPAGAGFPHLFVNPPLAAWLLRPLDRLPVTTGLAVFVVLSVIAILAAARLLELRLPRSLAEGPRTLLVVAATASLPAAMTLLLGQWDGFVLLAAAAAIWMLDRDRPLTAGLLLSMLLVKPQLAWLLLPVLLLAARRRVAAGFALGLGGWVGSGLLLIGPRQSLQAASLIRGGLTGDGLLTTGLPALVGAIAGGPAVFVAGAVCGTAVVAAAWRYRAQLRAASPALAVSVGLIASLLCAPHVFSDDLLMVAVPLVVIAPSRPRAALVLALALSGAFILDEWVANVGPRWAEAVVLVAVGACLVRLLPNPVAGRSPRPVQV